MADPENLFKLGGGGGGTIMCGGRPPMFSNGTFLIYRPIYIATFWVGLVPGASSLDPPLEGIMTNCYFCVTSS